MYILEFLKQAARAAANAAPELAVEHRLLCSGELYNSRILASDWRKSDVKRVLLLSPFELFVTSRPFDAYPQELCLRFPLDYCNEVAEADGVSFRRMFLPDDEIVED